MYVGRNNSCHLAGTTLVWAGTTLISWQEQLLTVAGTILVTWQEQLLSVGKNNFCQLARKTFVNWQEQFLSVGRNNSCQLARTTTVLSVVKCSQFARYDHVIHHDSMYKTIYDSAIGGK